MISRTAIAFGAIFTAALSAAAPAFAQATASTQSTAEIVDPAGVFVSRDLIFTVNAGGAISGVNMNGMAARFVLSGLAGDTVSVSAPAAFNVARAGDGAVLTVRTSAAIGDFLGDAGNDDVVLNGQLSGGLFNTPVQVVGRLDQGQLSFSIAGQVMAANALTPGDYHGVLTVIAQYN
jgi:hypothetical protein